MMRRLMVTLAVLTSAACQTALPESHVAPAVWAERSATPEEYRRAYPVAAHAQEIEGRVTLLCTVISDWTLDCGVETETPPGWGFGDAALRLSRFYIVRRDYPNVGVGSRVRLPVRFVMG